MKASEAQSAMLEYTTEVLKLVAKKAEVETLLKNKFTKRFYKLKEKTFEFDLLNFEMKNQVNKKSILNLIKKLK